ncbi:hypothetical protein P7C73_g4396, partial [Tremellales sp. Uapishka_1]
MSFSDTDTETQPNETSHLVADAFATCFLLCCLFLIATAIGLLPALALALSLYVLLWFLYDWDRGNTERWTIPSTTAQEAMLVLSSSIAAARLVLSNTFAAARFILTSLSAITFAFVLLVLYTAIELSIAVFQTCASLDRATASAGLDGLIFALGPLAWLAIEAPRLVRFTFFSIIHNNPSGLAGLRLLYELVCVIATLPFADLFATGSAWMLSVLQSMASRVGIVILHLIQWARLVDESVRQQLKNQLDKMDMARAVAIQERGEAAFYASIECRRVRIPKHARASSTCFPNHYNLRPRRATTKNASRKVHFAKAVVDEAIVDDFAADVMETSQRTGSIERRRNQMTET